MKAVAFRISRKIFTDEGRTLSALFIFVIAYIAVTYFHLKANTAPPRWDDSWYLANSEIIFKAFQGNDVFSSMYFGVRNVNGFYLFSLFSRLMWGIKAPLIALITLPGYLVFGSGFRGLTITYFLLIVCFTWVYYKFTSRVSDRWTAFLATVITSTMPLTIGLSRMFLVEYGLMILTVLWVSLQLQSDNFRDRRFSIPLGIVLGFGMLMKVTFPIYVIGPILWGLISSVRTGNSKRQFLNLFGNCMIVLLIGIVVMSSWYIKNINQVLINAFNSGFGSASQDYSLGSVFDINTLLKYWIGVINGGISFYYFVILLFFFMIEMMKHILHVKKQTSQMVNKGGVRTQLPIFIIWFLVPFLIFSLGVNKDYRFLLPALPALGFIISQLIMDSLGRKSLRITLIPLLLIVPCFLFGYTSLPLSVTYTASVQSFLIIAPNNGYAMRPVRQIWDQQQILLTIEQDAIKNNVKIDFPIGVLPSSEYFNANNFMYFSIAQNLPYQFEAFSPAKDQTELTSQRERLFKMDYLITKTGDQCPSFACNPGFTPLLLQGKLPFVEVTRFNLPDGSEGIIYRKK
jgi:4-amino-4-deoxy-L-arabinose transferase-like glycosyltransferase